MAKDKLNLDQLMNNLNQAGLNVINFDEHFQEKLLNEKEKADNDIKNFINVVKKAKAVKEKKDKLDK